MFEAFRKYTECEHLGFSHRLVASGPVSQYTGQLGRFRKPATVHFEFTCNFEVHDRLRGHCLDCTRAGDVTPNVEGNRRAAATLAK